jgi:NAD-dependent DNA ligase
MVAGGVRSIYALLRVTPQELTNTPGIGLTLATQFYQDLHDKIVNVPLARIMDASNFFGGVGEKRFEAILDVYPNFLDFAQLDDRETANYIRAVRGFNILADHIAEKLEEFVQWLKHNPMIIIEQPQLQPAPIAQLPQTPFPQTPFPQTPFPQTTFLQTRLPVTPYGVQAVPTATQYGAQTVPPATQYGTQTGNKVLTGMTFVFSGFRGDLGRDLEARIKRAGGKVTGAVSRNTTMLIMKDTNDRKGKANEALEKGIPLISVDQFIARFNI